MGICVISRIYSTFLILGSYTAYKWLLNQSSIYSDTENEFAMCLTNFKYSKQMLTLTFLLILIL